MPTLMSSSAVSTMTATSTFSPFSVAKSRYALGVRQTQIQQAQVESLALQHPHGRTQCLPMREHVIEPRDIRERLAKEKRICRAVLDQ